MKYKFFTFLLGLLFIQLSFATQHIVNTIRVSGSTQRLVIEVDGAFKYRSFTLADPHRLVVDILDTRINPNFTQPDLTNTPITAVRIGIRHQTDLRLVFDLKEPIHKHDFVLEGKGAMPHRLVVDWSERDKALARITQKPKALTPLAPPEETVPKNLLPQRNIKSLSFRNMVIVIDPGHGGRDPGALGSAGTQEKNVVLAISKQIKENLDKLYGVKTVLTRQDDYYIPLRKRLEVARNNNADLFVSIHADAYQEGHSNGASIYALSQSGASSEVARWVADRENYSELGGVDLNELQDSSDMLRTMLLDLSQTATIAASVRLGDALLKNLSRVVNLHKSRVEQAPFVVLKSPDIPSILIEVGFISNNREEKQLRSYLHQHKLARAISKGIFNYARSHAPIDTFFAQRYRKTDALYAEK